MDITTTGPVTATAHNRAGTISVRTTDEGLPVDLRIDPRELRYGAARLSAEILTLNNRAAREAAALRREQLDEQGLPRELLDRMGLPTRESLAREQQPESWLHRA